MTDLSARLADALKEGIHLAEDRAVAELRASRPLLLVTPGGDYLIAALDGISPSLFETFRSLEGAGLALTPQRAQMMGLALERGITFALQALSQSDAVHLASGVQFRAPKGWHESGPDLVSGIDLCKKALLLPALLVAGIADGHALPEGLYRYKPAKNGLEGTTPFDLEIVAQADVPMADNIGGRFVILRGGPASRDQVAIVIGDPDPAKPVPVRIHSACFTGDLFGSMRCDCGDQLHNALAQMESDGGGVLIYLDQEGRGIGIANKMRAYALQDQGFDTIDADAFLGFNGDERGYDYAAAILKRLGYRKIVLLTNNPKKIAALAEAGIEIVARQPVFGRLTRHNENYLNTKAVRADHLLDDMLDCMSGAGE